MSIGSYFASSGFTGANFSPSAPRTPYSAALLQNTPSLSTTSGFSVDLLRDTSAIGSFSLGGGSNSLSTDSFLGVLNDQANRALYDSFQILKAYQSNLQQDFNRVNSQISNLGYQGFSAYI